MKLPFSSNTDKQAQAKLIRAKRNFGINQRERQATIKRVVADGIKSATTPRSSAYASIPGMENYATSSPKPVTVEFWLQNSTFNITHYKDLAEDRQNAVDADVAYFNQVIAEQRKKHPNWDIVIEYSTRDRTLPEKIRLTKK